MGVQSPSKIKPPADCRGAQKKNVMQSMTRTSQQVRQGVLEMKLKNVLIVVNDMERSIRFYDPDGNLIEVGTPVI